MLQRVVLLMSDVANVAFVQIPEDGSELGSTSSEMPSLVKAYAQSTY